MCNLHQCMNVHLSGHTSVAVVKTKIELDSQADTCVVGDHCLIVHDQKRSLNVYEYNLKVGSKHAHIIDAIVAYTEPETGQVFILLLKQAIEINRLNHHLLCPMQCCMNGVLMDEVPNFLAPVTSEMMHAIQIENPFDTTHPIIIHLKLNGVTSYFDVKKPTQEEYEDENILKIKLTAEAPPWDLSSP